jgi:serine/threonine protein kinase
MEFFQHWEHSYLVTEWVGGDSLYHWMLSNNPALHIAPTATAFGEYYRRSLALLDELAGQIRRLHELGFVFVDLSPNNVLVDDEDRVRLIDFEAAQPISAVRRLLGTPGYQHPAPRAVAEQDPGNSTGSGWPRWRCCCCSTCTRPSNGTHRHSSICTPT